MKITSVDFTTSAVRRSQYPVDKRCEFLLVGRSNVGKSSFINAFTGRKMLAKTSSKPGKTRTMNFFLIDDDFYLVDAPGYGYANKSYGTRLDFGEYIEEYLHNNLYMKEFLQVYQKVQLGTLQDDRNTSVSSLEKKSITHLYTQSILFL